MTHAPDLAPHVPGHRLDSVVGRGASSTVWSGRDAVGRPVAVKVPDHLLDEVDLAQAEIERHTLMAVRHDHLVPLRDVVRLDDGRVALVFDLVHGAGLVGMVGARGHLRPGETVTVVQPLCEAVAALHSAGGTHGDVSAANVMVTADGRPLLLDLGSVRLAGRGGGAVFGTPGFVAPEVREGAAPGEASDVFALGAVAWFCATGNGAPDTMLRLDPEVVESHVGPQLAHVVGACLDPDPTRRPSSGSLARLFHDAAWPEPVEVVLGSDDASALTHRLRAEASRDAPAPGAEVVVLRSMLRRRLGLARNAGRGPGVGRFDARRTLVGLAIAVLAVAALVWVGGAAWSMFAAPESPAPEGGPAGQQTLVAAPGPGPTASANPVVPTPHTPPRPPTPSAGAQDPRVPVDSPRARPVALVQTLSDLRAKALMSRDPRNLGAVHAAGSASLRVDERLVGAMVTSGSRYERLRLQVVSATLVSATTTRAAVRARIDTAAYVVVGPTGAHETRPAERGEVLDLSLVRVGGQWRIEAVTSATAR